jgi:hypothetical protein
VNNNVPINSDTPAWRFQTWAAFAFSLLSTSIAIWWLPVGPWEKGLVGLGLWFTVSSCFALAKSERDQHEAKKLTAKVSEIQTERILRDMTKEAA